MNLRNQINRTAKLPSWVPLRAPDLVTHLRISDNRYFATVPTEFLATNQPPIFITLYFIVSPLPDSLRSIRNHFLSMDPTSLTVDLLEQHLLAAETSAVAVGAAHGTPRPPFFEVCSPSPLSPSFASTAAADVSVTEDVGDASTSAKRRSSKGKGGRGGGGGSGGGGGGSGSSGGGSGEGGGGSGGGGNGGTGGGSGGFGGSGGGNGGSGGSGGGGTGGGRSGPRHGGPSGDLLRSGVAIFDLDYDAIISAMYALSFSADADCYRCVPPDPGSSLCTLATEPPQIAASAQVSASGQVATSCSCRLLSHQTLVWHHRLGHPSLPHLRGMYSRLLVSGLPMSLPPLPPSPAPPCLPCVKGRQRAAPHSSFPLTTAPLQTLHMDVSGPARISGQGRER
ncbi:unnamed protein product [Closterium sp. NIES-53]